MAMQFRTPDGERLSSLARRDFQKDFYESSDNEYLEIDHEDEEGDPWVGERRLTQTLGWLSVGLGIAGLLAPRAVGRAMGIGEHPAVLRAVGVRELTAGLGLLSERAPGRWAVSRVIGDTVDLGLLGAAVRQRGADRTRIAIAAAAVVGITALDIYASRRLGGAQSTTVPVEDVTQSITINATPETLYRYWRNLENFPRFMRHLKSVEVVDERVSRWVATAPAGTSIEWDAEIVEDQANARIAWRTLSDVQVEHAGIVSFEPAPGGRGTVVRVSLRYVPPAGRVGVRIAKLFGEEPNVQIREDLRCLKQLIETGELATTAGQPSGRRSVLGRTTLGRWLS